jgi:hypothetical protein
MAECTALLREARSAYSLHISEEVEGGAVDADVRAAVMPSEDADESDGESDGSSVA